MFQLMPIYEEYIKICYHGIPTLQAATLLCSGSSTTHIRYKEHRSQLETDEFHDENRNYTLQAYLSTTLKTIYQYFSVEYFPFLV
jgi:hypothetical protein